MDDGLAVSRLPTTVTYQHGRIPKRGDGEEIALHRPALVARAATPQLVARRQAGV